MSDRGFYTQLDLDKALRPLSTDYVTTTGKTHFKATITPPLDGFGSFKATQHTYRSFTAGTISIIGRSTDGTTMHQLHIFIASALKNDKYRIEDFADGEISVGIVTGGVLYEGAKGKLSIEQNENKTFVEAKFNYEILYLGKRHKAIGELSLGATEFR
jgi:hypothetical protein